MKTASLTQRLKSVIVLILFMGLLGFSTTQTWATDWYVNNEPGSDETGTGSSSSPWRTITYAVSHSEIRAGDVILVQIALTYNEANGEVFPIHMPDNVDLRGVPEPIIDGSILPSVQGGGPFDEGMDTPRNVTVFAADGSTISNLKLIAEDSPEGSSDGTSIMCQSTSPTIQYNVFIGHGRSNITTIGDAHPAIQENVFRGHTAWGITAYDQSAPTVEHNDFYGTGGIDCTFETRPVIHDNTFLCDGIAVSLKGESDATIINNTIEGRTIFGICFRMQSTGLVQDNVIQNCPTGIYIHRSNTIPPDLGGGGRSEGGNTFDNNDWDLENCSPNPVIALHNTWTHSPCCEYIDATSIYDDEDDELENGAVDFGMCLICTCTISLAELWAGMSDPGVSAPPSPYDRHWRYVPIFGLNSNWTVMDDFIFIFDPAKNDLNIFSKAKLGIKQEDGPVTAAFPVKGWKDKQLYAAALPFVDSKELNTGLILQFDADGNIVSRIEGTIKNEKLGLSMDAEKHEIVVASTQRVLRLAFGQIDQEVSLDKELQKAPNILVRFIPDRDGDKRSDIQISLHPSFKKTLSNDKLIKIIGSQTGTYMKQQMK